MSNKGNRKTAFLDPAAIDVALARIAAATKQDPICQPIAVALAGGCALQLYGSPRFTQDVDLIAAEDLHAIRGIRTTGRLSFGGKSLVTKEGTPIDVIVRSDQYADLYAEALIFAKRLPGSPIRVVTLPYLAAMKLAAGRGKDEQDLEFILCDASSRDAKYADVRAIVKQHLGVYAADELDAFRDLAKWRRKAGK